jgi:DNA-binding NtrC family response regulator
MVQQLSKPDSVNVLLSNADWAWPQAVAEIFQPRGFNALVASSAREIVQLISNHRIHLAILDMLMEDLSGMQALKIIRQQDQLLPCILLAQKPGEKLLADALALHAFSVLAKPVDMFVLADQVDRLFRKQYSAYVTPALVPKEVFKLKVCFKIEGNDLSPQENERRN